MRNLQFLNEKNHVQNAGKTFLSIIYYNIVISVFFYPKYIKKAIILQSMFGETKRKIFMQSLHHIYNATLVEN